MLAFWDVRDAQVAKNILSHPSTDALAKCVGDDKAEDGMKTWITCEFITREELVEVQYVLHLCGSPLTDRATGHWQFNFPRINRRNLLPRRRTRQGSRWRSQKRTQGRRPNCAERQRLG